MTLAGIPLSDWLAVGYLVVAPLPAGTAVGYAIWAVLELVDEHRTTKGEKCLSSRSGPHHEATPGS